MFLTPLPLPPYPQERVPLAHIFASLAMNGPLPAGLKLGRKLQDSAFKAVKRDTKVLNYVGERQALGFHANDPLWYWVVTVVLQ